MSIRRYTSQLRVLLPQLVYRIKLKLLGGIGHVIISSQTGLCVVLSILILYHAGIIFISSSAMKSYSHYKPDKPKQQLTQKYLACVVEFL